MPSVHDTPESRARNCLDGRGTLQGKWEAIRRDSEEFKRAEREALARKANKLAKKYGG
jgi:hypothetical protein